nr:DUF6492 family protein [uncultured Marinobacter sp.]
MISDAGTESIVIITPTWAGDWEHFRLMRASLESSPLANLSHYVVVQTEDLPLFEEFRDREGLELLSTKDVLPEEVEVRRKQAKILSRVLGRTVTKLLGSLNRLISWPKWPSYTGWHTQQLCKLKLASELDCDIAIILDSDIVVTPSASISDFSNAQAVRCFADWKPRNLLTGKVRNWISVSESAAGVKNANKIANTYFDTPFIFHRKPLRSALAYLEAQGGGHWWQELLRLPPRRWSEFGYYKAFLEHHVDSKSVEWYEPSFTRYVYDTHDAEYVVDAVKTMLADPDVHYITIHSHSSGRENWDPRLYIEPIKAILAEKDE